MVRRSGKKVKAKYNNKYKIPNEKADDILGLSNKGLVARVNSEYNNWITSETYKKDELQLCRLRDQIKAEKDEMKEDSKYIELEDEFNKRKEELVSEELARYEEELKNLVQPFNEDIKDFKNMFKFSMDELTRRKQDGLLKLDHL